ncbi:hypothetical protein B9Z55_016707 [Caenorhabditis nigoni]|nr:hypothetical protein B9Z55_016707 [Caenorhabditis nigoni]
MRRQKNGTFLHRMKCANEPMAMQKALQNYINLIFHYSEPNKLYLMMECEGSLPNVTNVQEIEIKHETVDRQFFTNVLTMYPDHHTISVRVLNRDIPSEFFQIQNIHVKYANGPDCFRNFVGRNMRLGCATSTEQDLIQFLQKWISNEAYHNLESLTMFIMNDINTVLIRQSVEFEEYDPNEPEKRPRDYVLDIPMPINLLNLPRLVGVSVVAELLDYQEIFLLSLCSRRTKCLVEKAKIKVPKLAFLLKQRKGYNELMIGVVFTVWYHDIWLPVTSVMHVDTLTLKETFTVKLGNYCEADANFDVWCDEDGTFLHRMESANEPMAIQKALQDHINSIFHYSETNKLYLSIHCEGSLPNVTNVQEIEIKHTTVDPQFLTDVLTMYPDHHTISLRRVIGDIPNDSLFFQIQNIHVMQTYGSNYIHNFVGRNMRLGSVTYSDQDLIKFLKNWISNEAYHNLETLTMRMMNEINAVLIRQSVEFEEYDPNEPEKRPKEYALDIPYDGSFPTMYPIRDKKFVEIKRITDGKRAFLEVSNRHFNFLVLKN